MVDIINFVDVCAELAHVMRIAQHYRIISDCIRRTVASYQNKRCIERQIEQVKYQGLQGNATHLRETWLGISLKLLTSANRGNIWRY
jgi:hypothetical protein